MTSLVTATKIGMTQYIDDKGIVIPVTLIKLVDTSLLFKKNKETHGYDSLVYAYVLTEEKKCSKPKIGFFNKYNSKTYKHVKEFRLLSNDIEEANSNSLDLKQFQVNDLVKVSSLSKGKGFTGTIKAHNFARGPMTHGSKNHRLPGSIGAGTDPARVFKGTKMAKRKGNKKVTIKNISIINIDYNENIVFLKGCLPGKNGQLLTMYK